MKTKEMLIIEVSKEFKEELDKLDTVSETRAWFNGLEIGKDMFTELCEAQRDLQYEYVTQVLMYLVSTRNYVQKEDTEYYTVYGLNVECYFTIPAREVKYSREVFVERFDTYEESEQKVKQLNEFKGGE